MRHTCFRATVMGALVVLLLLTAAETSLAASQKGVQLVVLARWSKKSCDNFLEVAALPNAPYRITIAFVPSFNSSRPYENARYVIDRLLAAGKEVSVVVHLAYHDKYGTDSELQANARRFKTGLFAAISPNGDYYANRVFFRISPSLEDQWSDSEFASKAKKILAELDWNLLTSRHKLWRSPDPGDCAGTKPCPLPEDVIIDVTRSGQTKRFRVQREFHSYFNKAGAANAFSNDGVFVWTDQPYSDGYYEAAGSAANADTSWQRSKYTLTSFFQNTETFDRTVLLWRPRYNLFAISPRGKLIKFAKPRDSNGDIPAERRSDSDLAPAFDEYEKIVLRRFLGIS